MGRTDELAFGRFASIRETADRCGHDFVRLEEPRPDSVKASYPNRGEAWLKRLSVPSTVEAGRPITAVAES